MRGVPLRCPYHYTHKKNKFISNISCLQTYYTRRLWLKKILQALHVTGASHELVLKAVDMDYFMDFEDCLQDRCAESVNAQYIITNNVKDFKESVITAITPRDFERLIKQ